jgi:ATP-dependent DNA helicase RecG
MINFAHSNFVVQMTISELIRLKESEDKVEFKEAKAQYSYKSGRKSVLGYVVALANEGGGYLAFGVRESSPHEICGSVAWERLEGKLEQDIYHDLKIRVQTEILHEGEKRVLILKIPSRPTGKPLYFEDVPLMRVGESLTKMSEEMYVSIIQEHDPDFSEKICEGLTPDDLDKEAIAVLKKRYAEKQQNPAFETLPDGQILSDLGLVSAGKLNYAALILLGSTPALREYLHQTQTVIEYRLNHSMIPYTARQEFQEPLITGIDKMWAYINQPASNPLLHLQNGPYIYDIPSFNEEVIREAILNAYCHRIYYIQSDIFIKQYPDSIVITNAGGFPPGVTKDNILTVNSLPRCKRLAEVLLKVGLVERSGQGVDKMYYNCLMESKPLPDYSNTDAYQVELRLKAEIIDKNFYLFLREIQRNRSEKLNVFDLLTLNKVQQGISTGLYEASVEKLQRERLIKSQSSADKKYVLDDLYYEIAKQPAYIKEYRARDLQIVASCFEKAKEVYMKDFVDAFDNQLSRGQIKFLILKLEAGKLLTKIKAQKYTHYILNDEIINVQHNIYTQFIEILSK